MQTSSPIKYSLFSSILYLSACSPWIEMTKTEVKLESFEYRDTVSDGWVRVRSDSLWGYYQPEKKRFITPQLEWAQNFTYGGALVRHEGQFAFLNITQGAYTADAVYDEIRPYADNRYLIREGNRLGMIDDNGNEVLPADYRKIEPIENHYSLVTAANGRKGIVDHKGNVILPVDFTSISKLTAGRFRFIQRDQRQGLIDTLGNVVVPPSYDHLGYPSENRIAAFRNGKTYWLIDTAGQPINDHRYNRLEYIGDSLIRGTKGKEIFIEGVLVYISAVENDQIG